MNLGNFFKELNKKNKEFAKKYEDIFKEWRELEMEYNEKTEKVVEDCNKEACACVDLSRMMGMVLDLKKELLKPTPNMNKKEMYGILSSIEFEIKMMNDENNHIQRY